jgi:hypothetical protein
MKTFSLFIILVESVGLLSQTAYAGTAPAPTASYLPSPQSTKSSVNLKQSYLLVKTASVANVSSPSSPNPSPSTVIVPSTAGPWDIGVNPEYNYGSHDNTAPTVFPVNAGQSLTLTYAGGTIQAGLGWPIDDADGDTSFPENGSTAFDGDIFPSFYMSPYPIYLVELVGVFTDANGVIQGKPFAVGDGPTKVTAPVGSTQLQLGINDGTYYDNVGSLIVQITESSTYSLSVSINGQSATSFPIEPTILSHIESNCSSAKVVHNSLPVSVRCIDQSTGTDYQGATPCSYTAKFTLGPNNNGGHDHTGGARPLACAPGDCPDLSDVIEDGDNDTIEEDGSTMVTYAAPEVSGDVILTLTGTDPNNNPIPSQNITFNVQVLGSGPGNWLPLSNEYLDVIINGADLNPSHQLGYYGTPNMSAAMELLGTSFVENLVPLKNIPSLLSQAGSLPWGGLYDIDQDWTTGHCGHRDGKTIDLSLKNLSYAARSALQQAAKQSKMNFYLGESPNSPLGSVPPSHWHAFIQ